MRHWRLNSARSGVRAPISANIQAKLTPVQHQIVIAKTRAQLSNIGPKPLPPRALASATSGASTGMAGTNPELMRNQTATGTSSPLAPQASSRRCIAASSSSKSCPQ
jgi:hypothetical protein